MLKVDLLGLKEGINPVSFSLSGDIPLFRQLDIELGDQGRLAGNVDKRDDDLFLFSLSMSIPVLFPCRRCLAVFTENVRSDFTFVAMMRKEREINDLNDSDVILFDLNQKEIDLEEIVREHFLLNLPTHPLCDDNCRGICPGCGVDLNNKNCNCVAKNGSTETKNIEK